MTEITVELGARAYPVVVAEGFDGFATALDRLGLARRAIVITDDNVGPLWADRLGLGPIVTLPSGEAHKSVATWASAVDAVLDEGIDRKTPIVALGGGVVGDLAGFVAASVLRGVPFVQVPTTLLAMVDSSVGGKVGVNHPRGKNLVGAFHQPRLVWAPLCTLATLPAEERVAGLGEVVKAALIADEDLLARLERDAEALAAGDVGALAPVVARCIAIKAAIVAQDEREGGVRAFLNAGHTVGHALEHATGYGTLRHGEAVALGLVAETRFAVRRGLCGDPGLPDRLVALLARLGLPTIPPDVAPERLLAAMQLDKKTAGDTLVVPVPARAGRMVLFDLPASERRELLSG